MKLSSFLLSLILVLSQSTTLKNTTLLKNTTMIAGGSGGGGATFTFVQTVKTSSDCMSSPCTVSISPTAGHLIVIDYGVLTTGVTGLVGYDNQSSSYSSAVADSAAAYTLSYWGEFYNCSIGAGVTSVGVNYTGAASTNIIVKEYSYTGGTCALDKVSSASSYTGTGTTITASGVTTTIANELISSVLWDDTVSQAVTATGGYTNRGDSGFGAGLTISSLEKIVSSTGTYAGTGTVSTSCNWAGYTISYK